MGTPKEMFGGSSELGVLMKSLVVGCSNSLSL